MRNSATVLIDHENDRQARVQQLALAFGCRLLDRVEDFLKRHYRDHCRDHFLIISTAKHGFSNRERHLLPGTDNLWATNDEAAPVHLCEHLADSGVNFFELDHIGLKSAVKCSVDGPEDQGDEVWVLLESVVE